MQAEEYRRLGAGLIRAAAEAGRAILAHYRAPITVEVKPDDSPVTAADRAAEAIILAALAELAPGVTVIAEEAMSAGRGSGPAQLSDPFFLVDPLDGTKEFINRRDEFTVNIALIEQARPVFGLVYAPALSRLYLTKGPGSAAVIQLDADQAETDAPERPIEARLADPGRLTVVASRSHMNEPTRDFIARFQVDGLRNAGSSLKFCLLAEGAADLYPRLGPTMEWDTAAGHAVLAAAGGTVSEISGKPLLYGKLASGFRNPHFVAWGRRD